MEPAGYSAIDEGRCWAGGKGGGGGEGFRGWLNGGWGVGGGGGGMALRGKSGVGAAGSGVVQMSRRKICRRRRTGLRRMVTEACGETVTADV